MGPNDHFDFKTSESSSGDSSSTKLPKLAEDGSNWILYKSQFIAAVTAQRLKRYLDGRETTPTAPTASGVDSDADAKYEDALDAWHAKHNKIKTILFQSLPETLKLKIAPFDRASQAWKVVTDQYDNQGDFVQISILRKLQQLKCENNTDPRPLLDQLEKYRGEYTTAGGTLSDDQFKAMIISTLPESYTSEKTPSSVATPSPW